MRIQKATVGAVGGIIGLYLLFVVLLLVGWGVNIYKLCQCDFEAPYKAEAVRSVGIFVPPVGAIASCFTFEEEKK